LSKVLKKIKESATEEFEASTFLTEVTAVKGFSRLV
jgi:hypothetical protein